MMNIYLGGHDYFLANATLLTLSLVQGGTVYKSNRVFYFDAHFFIEFSLYSPFQDFERVPFYVYYKQAILLPSKENLLYSIAVQISKARERMASFL